MSVDGKSHAWPPLGQGRKNYLLGTRENIFEFKIKHILIFDNIYAYIYIYTGNSKKV